MSNKIGCIGDLHFKDNLGYADYIADRRIPEKEEILNFIVKTFSDCNKIVFLGDQLNSKHSSSNTIKEFVEFIERFSGKEIFILAGNHEKYGDGRSAIDFLKEIKNPNWHIITNKVETFDNLTFCPFFTHAELGTTNNSEASKKLMKMLDANKILFHHHTMSGTKVENGIGVGMFNEPILPVEKLLTKFEQVIGGHIHKPSVGRVIVSGSIFNNEVGEHGKLLFKLDDEHPGAVEQFIIPGRGIYKIENPGTELSDIPKNSIIKAIITKEQDDDYINGLRSVLSEFDAHIIIEQIPRKRKKLVNSSKENILEFSIDDLLDIYAKEKDIDIKKLQHAMNIIR